MKYLLFLIITVISINFFGQTNYSIGFADGYKVGYCYNLGVNCVTPVVPVTPLCRVGESYENYYDGYNRGLLMGAYASGNKKQNRNSTGTYGNPTYVPNIPSFKPDYSFYEKALDQNQQNYDQKKRNEKEFDKKLLEICARLDREQNDPEKITHRKEYINFLKRYYNSFKNYPQTIKDGWHKIVLITEPQEGYETTKNALFIEGEEVYVENNKIIIYGKYENLEDAANLSAISVEKVPINPKTASIYIIENAPILNGLVKIRCALNMPGEGLKKLPINDIYFFEAIEDNNKKNIEIKSNNAKAFYSSGDDKYKLKDYQGAIKDYTRVIAIEPDNTSAYNNRGICKYFLEDKYGAIEDFTKAIVLNPNDGWAFAHRGSCKYFIGDYKGAMEDNTKAIVLDTNYADAYTNRGNSKYKLGDNAGACKDWKQAVELGNKKAQEAINKYCK